MALTEQELIQKLQALKQIKPNQAWADLTLKNITQEPARHARPADFAQVLWTVFSHHKLAYSLAVFGFVMVGLMGFAQYTVPGDALFPVKRLAEQGQANLLGSTQVAQQITTLNNRAHDLAEVAKQGKQSKIPATVSEIKAQAPALAQAVKNKELEVGQTKEIAAALQVLAQVPGTDLQENSEVQDLYQAVVEAQVAELKDSTLTEKQKDAVIAVEILMEKGKYAEALEIMLLVTN